MDEEKLFNLIIARLKDLKYNGISIILIIIPLSLLLLRQLPPLTMLDLSESTFIYGYMWIDGRGKLFNLIIARLKDLNTMEYL